MSVSNSSKLSIKEKTDAAGLQLISNKSADRYKKELDIFKQWQQRSNRNHRSCNVGLYFGTGKFFYANYSDED